MDHEKQSVNKKFKGFIEKSNFGSIGSVGSICLVGSIGSILFFDRRSKLKI